MPVNGGSNALQDADARAVGGADTAPLLEVSNLTVLFELDGITKAAVDNVSFTVNPGETVAIVGQSGSGKSTAISAVLGLLPDNAHVGPGSSIVLDGTQLVGLKERELREMRGTVLALVPQDPMSNLNPVMRIGTQVGEAVSVHVKMERAEIEERSVEALTRAGLPDAATRMKSYPHEFSGGMRQRSLIAMGLAKSPKLLIADEPTSALDVTVQRTILDNLGMMVEESGTAVLLITHDLGLAAERADRVLVMNDGKLVEQGKALSLLTSPQHPYTKSLIAALPETRGLKTVEQNGSEVLLSAEHLVKEFRVRGVKDRQKSTFTAVDDVSFELKRGKTLAIVGESGSGKSTTASMVLRLLEPTSGSVFMDGEDVTSLTGNSLRAFRRRVQPVFQDPYSSLDPMYTIERIIREPLDAFNVGSQAERARTVASVLDRVGLPQTYLNRHPRELSGGQRQRVAIARALSLQPDLIVCDEAVSALDVLVQAQILDLLQEIQDDFGVSYLFITHDLGVVRAFATDVLVMQKGRVVESGPVRDVFTSPRDSYTIDLLEAVPGRSLFEQLHS